MPVTVKLSNGRTSSVEADVSGSVAQLKAAIAGAIGIAADEQRIVFKGKVLKDEQSCAEVGVVDGSPIHVVRSAAAKTTSSTASAASNAPAASPAAAPAPQPSAAPASTPPVNPYAALFASAGQTGAAPNAAHMFGMPGMGAGMGGDAQQQTMMNAMMQNPQMMQQMGQMLAANPAMMDAVMQSHPLFQGMPPDQRAATMQMVAQMMQSGMVPGMMGMGGAAGGQAPQQPPPAGMFGGGFNPFAQQGQQQGQSSAQRYAAQLEQLRNMGFPNESANLAALEMTGGNVEFAIARLLGD